MFIDRILLRYLYARVPQTAWHTCRKSNVLNTRRN